MYRLIHGLSIESKSKYIDDLGVGIGGTTPPVLRLTILVS